MEIHQRVRVTKEWAMWSDVLKIAAKEFLNHAQTILGVRFLPKLFDFSYEEHKSGKIFWKFYKIKKVMWGT